MPKAQIKSSEQPPAVGYVRLDNDDDMMFAGLLKDVAACCLREGLRLVQVFADRGDDGSQLARPGIAELQQTLNDTVGLTVVIPTLNHLAPTEIIRGPLLLMIHKLGGRVVVANEPNGKQDELGVTQYGVWVGEGDTGDEAL